MCFQEITQKSDFKNYKNYALTLQINAQLSKFLKVHTQNTA